MCGKSKTSFFKTVLKEDLYPGSFFGVYILKSHKENKDDLATYHLLRGPLCIRLQKLC